MSFMYSVAFPDNVPRIEGLREVYVLEEYLEANCTAKMTYPKAQVSWFINNNEVSNSLRPRNGGTIFI